jgi:cytochrome P450
MRSCLYYLCRHPAAYKQLQEEVDKFYKDNNLTEPANYSQTQEMPYLKAVVTESLRLFPSITYQLLRYSPEGGMSIDGRYIPAGYDIGISPIAQNRDEAVFGKDANDFRPERWLESRERTSSMESVNMTFGGNGPRTCIGRNISLV